MDALISNSGHNLLPIENLLPNRDAVIFLIETHFQVGTRVPVVKKKEEWISEMSSSLS